MLMAARAAHREFNAAPACHVSFATVRRRRVFVQRDHNGDAYPLADLRRCWRPDGVYRTPLHAAFEVTP
jgi:hypothetical protein